MDFHDRLPAGPTGYLKLNVWRGDQLVEQIELVETFEGSNLIVDGSKQQHARLIGGDVTNRSVTQIGFGTNGTAPVGGNTALTAAYTKAIDSVSYPATNQVQFNFSLASGEANGKAIMEFGLFTAAGVLYARKVRATALNKESDISFTGTWVISF